LKKLEFSEEEKKNIMQTEGFKDFFDYSTKIVERALDEPYDIMIDYRVDNTIEELILLLLFFFPNYILKINIK